MIVPIPPAKSIKTLLSTSVKKGPSPFLIYTLHTVPCPWATLFDLLLANSNDFFKGRFEKKLLSNLKKFEDKYFAKSFYREVDETVAVIPKRNIASEFYHR